MIWTERETFFGQFYRHWGLFIIPFEFTWATERVKFRRLTSGIYVAISRSSCCGYWRRKSEKKPYEGQKSCYPLWKKAHWPGLIINSLPLLRKKTTNVIFFHCSGLMQHDQRTIYGQSTNSSEWPRYDVTVARNITTAVGQTTFLNCYVHHKGDKQVSNLNALMHLQFNRYVLVL